MAKGEAGHLNPSPRDGGKENIARENMHLKKKLEAQQRLVQILKERVESMQILIDSGKNAADDYSRSALLSRESEISTLRFEAAQEKIQKSELEFIIKSLKVDIEEDRSRAEKSQAYSEELEEQVESYKTELEEVNGKLARLDTENRDDVDMLRRELKEEKARSDRTIKKLKILQKERDDMAVKVKKYQGQSTRTKDLQDMDRRLRRMIRERDQAKRQLLESVAIMEGRRGSVDSGSNDSKHYQQSNMPLLRRVSLSEHQDLATFRDDDKMKSNYAMDVSIGKENARA
ncbi:hypothetical protein NDN08_000922 [Rhodosorus marinus]|uniref:Cilia- and flagella-associated protein 157 n=1 Tax=Rhodosorus marinus TaxID=101924 RepID=A0AAV8UQW7_9RHOD|nr:hypothetical protein NDN08_000922 [Rhodosorus marinus]